MMYALRFKVLMAVLSVCLLSAAVWAQELPKIAVYVTGGVGANEKKALGTRMTTALVKSGQYQAVERSEEFLRQLDAEHVKQRSGAIDDGQISALGRQFGVKYVCVADITPVLDGYQVSARVINVETAGISASGDALSPMKTTDDFDIMSNKVVRNLLSTAPEQYAHETAAAQNTQQQPTVIVIQQGGGQTQPQAPKVRHHDYYFTPKVRTHDWYITTGYTLPWGTPCPWGAIVLGAGWVWGDGVFFGLDLNYGMASEQIAETEWHGTRESWFIGGGLSLGGVYELPVDNLQLLYGGSVGFWADWTKQYVDGISTMVRSDMVGRVGRPDIDFGSDLNFNFLGPFVKARYNIMGKAVELSYRGLLGWQDDNAMRNGGFGWNSHQITVGFSSTSRR